MQEVVVLICFLLNIDNSISNTSLVLTRQSNIELSIHCGNNALILNDRILFNKVINNFYLNKKKETLDSIYTLENYQYDIVERYKNIIPLIKFEVEQWKDEDIGDVARDMLKSKNNLVNGLGGPKTKQIQDDIIAKLDKLIKEKEDELNKKQKNEQENGESGQQKKKIQDNSQPLPDSQIQDSDGVGRVNAAKFRQLIENWGKLPPREQSKALQELTQGLSARHREGIYNYFRNIGNKK